MFEKSMSFVKTVGRSGIEALIKKGYKNKEIAVIYDISLPTLYLAYHQLYGSEWKKMLKSKLTANTAVAA